MGRRRRDIRGELVMIRSTVVLVMSLHTVLNDIVRNTSRRLPCSERCSQHQQGKLYDCCC